MGQPLFEQYRPQTWPHVVAQDKAVKAVKTVAKRGLAGRAWWISGASGTGKTTIARLIAAEVADGQCTTELDGSALTLPVLRQLADSMRYYGLGVKSGRAYIVNEAHGLRVDVIRSLLVLLEELPGHAVWLFTTTHIAQKGLFDSKLDAHPLLSRCILLKLSRQGLAEPFAARCKEIASAEGLDGQPPGAYVELARRNKNNFRAMLEEIEAGAML